MNCNLLSKDSFPSESIDSLYNGSFYLKAKVGLLNLIPNTKMHHYNKEKKMADDIYYNLDIYPQYSLSHPHIELIGNRLIKSMKEVGIKHFLALKLSYYYIQQTKNQYENTCFD